MMKCPHTLYLSIENVDFFKEQAARLTIECGRKFSASELIDAILSDARKELEQQREELTEEGAGR